MTESASAATESKREGGCLCGAVRFEITLPSKWCAHCHCSMCRRAHGAGVVTWFGVPEDRFRITAGEELGARFRPAREVLEPTIAWLREQGLVPPARE